MWIDYKEDLNCTIIAIEKNGSMNGSMTLKEVGKRLNLSCARIKQIEKAALEKIRPLLLDV